MYVQDLIAKDQVKCPEFEIGIYNLSWYVKIEI